MLAISASDYFQIAKHRLWMATGLELPPAHVLIVTCGIVALSSLLIGMTLKVWLAGRES